MQWSLHAVDAIVHWYRPNLSVQCVVVGFYELNVNETIDIVPERETESQIISRYFFMDAEFIDRSDQNHSWSPSRVTGRNLDPRKHWHVAAKGLCGVRLNAFANNEIVRRFPDKIRSVPPADLKPATRACSSIPGNQTTCTLMYPRSVFVRHC